MKTFTAIVAAAAFVALSAGQAAAQTDAPLKAAVSYADLDLSRASGRSVLESRVERAVESVCPRRPSPAELRKRQAFRVCHEQAWAGARQQLAAIYDGRQIATASVDVVGARR
jgi:UrcA family protein